MFGCHQTVAIRAPSRVSPHERFEEVNDIARQRRTSPAAAKAASKVLRDGRTSAASKKAAGSALSQAAPKSRKKK